MALMCKVRAGDQVDTTLLTPNQCKALDIRNVLKKHDDWLKAEVDACGTRACVYETGTPGTLVKITRDWEDVRGFVRGGKTGAVVPHKRIFELVGKSVQDNGETFPLYAIEVQRADPLTKAEEFFGDEVVLQSANAYLNGARQLRLPGMRPSDVIDVADACQIAVENESKSKFPRVTATPDVIEACKRFTDEALDVIDELAASGVQLTDAHGGNFGRHKGRLVAIDVGLSAPPDDQNVPSVPRLRGLGAMTDEQRKKTALAIAAAALLWLVLRPKKARAQENKPLPAVFRGYSALPRTRVIALEPEFIRVYGPVEDYVVQSGDSYSAIAQRKLGDQKLWPFLWDINRLERVSKLTPDAIEIGEIIRVPARAPANPAYASRFEAHRSWYVAGGRGVVPDAVAVFTPIPL